MARKARFHPISFKERIVSDYITGNYSYRELAATYDVNFQLIQRWVQKFTVAEFNIMKPSESKEKKSSIEPYEEVMRLKEELERAKLHNKLLESLLDIGREKYGIDLRKKNGTKQSRELNSNRLTRLSVCVVHCLVIVGKFQPAMLK